MKKILAKHKNTMVSVFGILFFCYSTFLLIRKEITFADYGTYLGTAGGMIATIIGLIAPDGKFSKTEKNEEIIIDLSAGSCSCPKCLQDNSAS